MCLYYTNIDQVLHLRYHPIDITGHYHLYLSRHNVPEGKSRSTKLYSVKFYVITPVSNPDGSSS